MDDIRWEYCSVSLTEHEGTAPNHMNTPFNKGHASR
jgi:hypothetical protein